MEELSEADLLEMEVLTVLGNLLVKLQSEIKEIERELEALYNTQPELRH